MASRRRFVRRSRGHGTLNARRTGDLQALPSLSVAARRVRRARSCTSVPASSRSIASSRIAATTPAFRCARVGRRHPTAYERTRSNDQRPLRCSVPGARLWRQGEAFMADGWRRLRPVLQLAAGLARAGLVFARAPARADAFSPRSRPPSSGARPAWCNRRSLRLHFARLLSDLSPVSLGDRRRPLLRRTRHRGMYGVSHSPSRTMGTRYRGVARGVRHAVARCRSRLRAFS